MTLRIAKKIALTEYGASAWSRGQRMEARRRYARAWFRRRRNELLKQGLPQHAAECWEHWCTRASLHLAPHRRHSFPLGYRSALV